MIAREGRSIHFGDFHGQWNAAEDELALLVAGLWRHGYDFTAFLSPDRQEALRATVERNRIPLRIFPGREYMYDWGHLTTVGTTGDAPPINDPDVESVLRWFKANSEWVVLAHPYAFMVDRLESLLDAGLLDAVELVNGPLDSNNNRKLIDWYASLLNRGKRVPIVSGLDIHVPVGDRRPDVLYDDAYPTSLDIPLLGANRTGVIADRCDVNAVRAAIADGRTFIEIPSERMLVGPPDIVAWLERNDYWAEVEAEQGRRCRFTPQSQRRFIGGSTVSLDCAGFTGLVGIDGREQAVPASGRVALPVPLKTPRDTQYVTLVGRDADAVSVAALKVFHPLQVQAAPRLANGRCQTLVDVVNVGSETIEDLVLTLSGCGIRVEERLPPLAPNGVMRRVHTWTVPEPARPTPFHVAIGNDAMKKEFSKYLVFIDCPWIDDPDSPEAWSAIAPIRMTGTFDEQIDTAYTTDWQGDADLSAEVRMAWNRRGLFFRMRIADDVLAPSRKPALLMFGDSLQIGVNPVATEAVGNQSFYDIMMTRGAEPDGVEKAWMERPVRMALEHPSSGRRLLEGLYTGGKTESHFEGLLFLPFHLIPPMQPVPGYRFGLYLVLFDNDGTGLETALQWPLHAERHLGQAWYIPYGGAWAGIELGPAPEA